MPMVGHIAENGLAIDDEFRESNAAPVSDDCACALRPQLHREASGSRCRRALGREALGADTVAERRQHQAGRATTRWRARWGSPSGAVRWASRRSPCPARPSR
jgi:hypothetical protein